MTNNSICNDEHNLLYKVLNFRLSHRFKKVGILGAILIFLLLISSKYLGNNALIVKDVLRTLILFFLLLSSLSKDKLEDEYNRYMRFQSFVIAFVATTVYSILIPLIAIILDIVITNINGDGYVSFYEISAFEVIFIMLGIQLLCFETLKRFGRV